MTSNVVIEASFDNVWDWKGTKQGKVIAQRLIQEMLRLPAEFSTDVTLVVYMMDPSSHRGNCEKY
jgi:hypothetical protein